jgi:hypothetical protein
MIHRRLFVAGALALGMTACATIAERTLPLAEVQGWRVANVVISFAPDASVILPGVAEGYVQRELQKNSPGLDSIPLDPTNSGRNPYAEKAAEIAASPGAKAHVQAAAVDLVRPRFQQVFAQAPAGTVPVQLNVIVKGMSQYADTATFNATAQFIDPKTGRVLLVHPGAGANRASRAGAMAGAAVGGGIIAMVAVGLVVTAMESGRPPPLIDVMDQTAVSMRTWLLKREGE